MECPAIECAIGEHVPEEERVAFASFVANPDQWKIRLAAFETVIEIKQKCEDALSPFGDFLGIARQAVVQEIVMRPEFLVRHVMEECRNLKILYRYAGQVCHASAQKSEHEIAMRQDEMAIAVGAGILVMAAAGRRIVGRRALQERPSKCHQP